MFVCVMKTGGIYHEGHVQRLQEELNRDLICLTDKTFEVDRVTCFPLRHNWEGWWSKIELFSLTGPVVYLDLDVTIEGNPDELYRKKFTMWDDPLFKGYYNSSVMSWSVTPQQIYHKFLEEGQTLKRNYRRFPKGGDQGFISDYAGEINSYKPGLIRSYRNDVKKNGIPDGTVVVAYHGRPKPWEV